MQGKSEWLQFAERTHLQMKLLRYFKGLYYLMQDTEKWQTGVNVKMMTSASSFWEDSQLALWPLYIFSFRSD